MILYDTKFDNRFHLEIVDGIDITKTYQNSSRVHSCMTSRASKGTKLYTLIPDCRMVRLLRLGLFRSTVALRALIWLGIDNHSGDRITALDRVYTEEMDGYSRGLMRDFLECWKLSVNGPIYNRGGLPKMWVYVPPIYKNIDSLPYMDSFTYYREFNKLCNFSPYFKPIKKSSNTYNIPYYVSTHNNIYQ